jgi:hypothetical protein
MASDAGTAAVADKHDLIAGAVGLMGRIAHPLAAIRQRHAFRGTVRDFHSMKELRQRGKISSKPLTH